MISIGDPNTNSVAFPEKAATTATKRKKKWVMPNDNYWDGVPEKPVYYFIYSMNVFNSIRN